MEAVASLGSGLGEVMQLVPWQITSAVVPAMQVALSEVIPADATETSVASVISRSPVAMPFQVPAPVSSVPPVQPPVAPAVACPPTQARSWLSSNSALAVHENDPPEHGSQDT